MLLQFDGWAIALWTWVVHTHMMCLTGASLRYYIKCHNFVWDILDNCVGCCCFWIGRSLPILYIFAKLIFFFYSNISHARVYTHHAQTGIANVLCYVWCTRVRDEDAANIFDSQISNCVTSANPPISMLTHTYLLHGSHFPVWISEYECDRHSSLHGLPHFGRQTKFESSRFAIVPHNNNNDCCFQVICHPIYSNKSKRRIVDTFIECN